jgi:hypothetical protein
MQHRGKATLGRLKPLFPDIQRLMDHEDETVKTTMRAIMQTLGDATSKLMGTEGMENLISLYLKEKDLSTLSK